MLCDELHEYNNASGQGDAMGELYGVSRLFVGMTATLINGYSSGTPAVIGDFYPLDLTPWVDG